MVQDLYYFEGTYRKGKTVHGMMNFNLGASLDLGLTHSGLSSDCNANLETSFGTRTPERGLDLRPLNPSMSLDLHLGHPQKEVGSSCLNLVEPDMSNRKVDLELSLSIGAAESDVTSMTLASSPIYARPDVHFVSSLAQLVDEGSTSSKWNAPFLLPLNALPNMEGPLSSSLVCPSPFLASLENPVPVEKPIINEGRKTNMKTCQYPGCEKGARGASGRCISHGGGRRCQRTGCQKGAEGRTVFCKSHGGGRRCEHLGCTKSAEGRTDFCIAHGGGKRCHHEGCRRAARGRTGFCIGHGGGKRCNVENCTKSAEGVSGHCIAHGGGRRCQYPDCRKGAQGSTKFCKAHGGGKRCTFLGCNKGAEGSTQLCKGHGGGKRCSFDGGCSKSVHGGTLFCVAHGGGKRCAVLECTRSARGKTDFCVRHGGGKRCKYEECNKSAQGSTDFCKAHGGGRRCLWGQLGSLFGSDGSAPCNCTARGKLGLCITHAAQMQDKCVHGENSTFSYMMQNSDSGISKKGKEIATPAESVPFESSFGGNENYLMPMNNNPMNQNLMISEGRVHGGGLMAMLMENLSQTVSTSSVSLAGNWV